MPTEYSTIQIRRATAAEWASEDPIPAEGEICWEKDTKKLKIGDGVTHYNLLSYFSVTTYGGAYLHTQTVSSSAWSVSHNIGQRYVVVGVIDASGNLVVPTSISFVDTNNLTITLSSSITGHAVVTVGGMAGTNGTDGTDGQGFTWRGAWQSGEDYDPYDVLTDDGSCYECILAIEDSTTAPGSDSTHFSVLASKGDKGDQGDTGAAGTLPIVTAGGTADAITADYSPDLTLSNLTLCVFVAAYANVTSTPTFAPDGLTAHTITKRGGQPLSPGDIPGAGAVCIVEYNSANTRWELLNPAENQSGWTQVTPFTATPASTSTLTMTADMTATILVGYPVKYTIGGTVYYGIVSAMASDLMTIAGAPLSGDVTALYFGSPLRVNQVNVQIPGLYEDGSNTGLIASDLNTQLVWNKTKAYLVRYRVYSKVHDSGTHGQASVRINSTEVNTVAGGLTIAADATWYSTVVDIAVAAYDVNPGEVIEVTAVKAGNGDATDLTVEMTFVIP